MSQTAVLSRSQPAAAPAQSSVPKPIVVMKFGSSVLRGPADAPAVASDIYAQVRQGRRVIAVVSAFEHETDRLLAEARALGLAHDNQLLPAYVAQGEARSAALTALACDRVGLNARTLSVREVGIVAEGPCEHARPVALNRAMLDEALERHEVLVVPGFAALSSEDLVVLLGRGGSDLTALFLAAELGLESVQLVKDVDGLYDSDPHLNPDARRYDQASWAEARKLGGRLVQPDAIDLAEDRRVRIEVRSHSDGRHTVIGADSLPPRRPDAPVRLRVAVAGCGVVGGGALARLLADHRVDVVGVLVRDPSKPRDVPGASVEQLGPLLVADADALLERRPHIVLEALSEARAGHDLISAALARGIDVASANKQAISRDPAGLAALADASGARLLWSAAIGGGTPMVETVRSACARGEVAGFEAVLNGTVNFMLERLDAGASFDDALAEARVAGFAEEDPSSDLEGLDSAAKLRLLAFAAFGVIPDEINVDHAVLDQNRLPPAGARQVARCHMKDGRLVADIRLDPKPDVLFSALVGEGNALKVFGQDGAVLSCRGRGAGRWATAESLLADFSQLAARHILIKAA